MIRHRRRLLGGTLAGLAGLVVGPLPAAGQAEPETPEVTEEPAAGPPHPRVALTFDAGADAGYAGSILDLLEAEGVPATFGITGDWARAHPDLVERVGRAGYQVLNHTVSHRSFTGLSDRRGGLPAAARRAELEGADAILTPLLGRSPRPWYRLPYGDGIGDPRVAADLAPTGYTRHAGWTVDSLGWRGLAVGEIVLRCLGMAAPGAVYLFHVGSAARDGPALGAIVDGLRGRGYSFTTVEGLDAP
jgi:peptidoglycan/xylan/chitin deacetylase (PgdA/CDA1 family)